jgi:methyl acetate hydrolase
MSTVLIDDVLTHAVKTGDVPNVVAVAANRDGLTYCGAVGPRVVGDEAPITATTRMRIVSMTKIVATVAALQQVERGAIELDSPVDNYLPEFAEVGVLAGFDGDVPRLRRPHARATVRQLMTHTAGFGYSFFNSSLRRWEQATGTPHGASGSKRIFTAPMVNDPGVKFEYGISTDWLGRIVERVSGQSLAGYLEDHVFKPLSMHQTTFSVPRAQQAELAPTHVRGEGGNWVPVEVGADEAPEYSSAGSGLYSTPLDYLSFQRMLLGRGAHGDVTIVRPATIESLFMDQLDGVRLPSRMVSLEPSATADLRFTTGSRWSLGLLLNSRQLPDMRAPGSGGWFGATNTYFWVDPRSGLTGAIYMQCMPLLAPGALRTSTNFERALYASISR